MGLGIGAAAGVNDVDTEASGANDEGGIGSHQLHRREG